MPKHGRPHPAARKQCVKRLRTLRILPVAAQNFESRATATPAPSTPPPRDVVRRSQRLQAKNKSVFAEILRKYEEKKIVVEESAVADFESDVVRRIRERVFKAAAVVDLVSSGQCTRDAMENNDNNNNGKRENSGQSAVFPAVLPRNAWVYKTPEKQKLVPAQRPQPTKQVAMGLARLYRATGPRRGNYMGAEESMVVISPIFDDEDVAAGGDDSFFKGPLPMWHPSTVGPHHHVVPSPAFQQQRRPPNAGPFSPRGRPFFAATDVPGHSSAFAPPTMQNLFPFLQSGVSPFPN